MTRRTIFWICCTRLGLVGAPIILQMMYVVLEKHSKREPLDSCLASLKEKFPRDKFCVCEIRNSFQLRLEGIGDERLPRTFALSLIKAWEANNK